MHTQLELRHGFAGGWCYRCHAQDASDELRLADGTHLRMDDAHVLCGSCHGPEHRDWEADLHGLTTGSWRAHKRRRSCTHCHDPHQPRIAPYPPEPAPAPPKVPSFLPSTWQRDGSELPAGRGGAP